MPAMTWRQLATKILADLNDEWIDSDVTIFEPSTGEFFGEMELQIYPKDGILDKGHPYLAHVNDPITEEGKCPECGKTYEHAISCPYNP